MNKTNFSNPDYKPKDFSDLYETDLGKQLQVSRLADQIRKQFPGVENIPAHIEKLQAEISRLNQQKEELRNAK